MVDLREEVMKRGFTVAHIKTDSIKIPDATPEIIKFVMDFGLLYGYTFEHEATYERMCLVNKAVYIAKYATPEQCMKLYGYVPDDCNEHGGEWTATGTQFAIPYVFKTLFSKEDIVFEDLCETFAVSKGDLYLDMNENLQDVTLLEKQRDKMLKKMDIDDRLKDKSYPEYEALEEDIADGHDLKFVGRVGQFCTVKDGCNGGVLYRVYNGKNNNASGASGYRWLESETVKNNNMEKDINKDFYNKLVDDAISTINTYGDFEWFASNDPYIPKPKVDMYIPDDADEEEGLPFN